MREFFAEPLVSGRGEACSSRLREVFAFSEDSHDLRHSCASLLLAKGIPMKMIQDWLGHSDMATTANIYSHIDSTSKRETAQAIGELLG